MTDETPDPQNLIRLARSSLSSAERRRKYRRIDFLGLDFWYRPQLEFFLAGNSGVHQRLIYGGNQTGKSEAAAFEVALHATGDYPDWWLGKRFPAPIRVWVIGESTMLVRDTVQRKLLGNMDEFGTGLIPLERFARKPVMVPGGTGAVDTCFVSHQTNGTVDGVTSITFKSFEQRREKLQGETVDFVWIDERPTEEVYSELMARTAASGGHIVVSYTPVGEGAAAGLTYRFLTEVSPDRATFRIALTEAKHISAERREELAENHLEHEREARLEGVPQLGVGPIFPVELLPSLTKTINPDEIPSYARFICGIDFGYGHPFAAVLVAWAHDTGQIWVIDSFRMERSSALYHVERIHSMIRGLRIPIAWPHDGATHDKGSGLPLAQQYKHFGANMLPSFAVNHGTNHFNVEPALAEMREMMFASKITIGGHNTELIEEMRHYHRDEDFKIVKQRDDLISALRYAIMMRRRGKPPAECEGIGYGNMQYSGHQPVQSRREPQLATGLDFDPF